MTHICVSELTIIGSDNGLSPGRHQAIIWTNDGILLIGTLGTNFSEILFGIQTFSFNKMHLKMSSAKWLWFCLGLNMLNDVFHSVAHNKYRKGCCWISAMDLLYLMDEGYQNYQLAIIHDDVIKWKHFPRYWPFVRGIHRSRWIPRTKASDAELWCYL